MDAGYPASDGHVIDLTLDPGIPRFLDVLRAVAEELVIESITVASEIVANTARKLYQESSRSLAMSTSTRCPTTSSEEQSGVKGIIRSAEFTPYANVRILCGSAFEASGSRASRITAQAARSTTSSWPANWSNGPSAHPHWDAADDRRSRRAARSGVSGQEDGFDTLGRGHPRTYSASWVASRISASRPEN